MTVVSPSFDQISPALDSLTPREAQVIKMRFGLEDCDEHTLEQIGQSLSLTRERVRQIEAKALGKLRYELANMLLATGPKGHVDSLGFASK